MSSPASLIAPPPSLIGLPDSPALRSDVAAELVEKTGRVEAQLGRAADRVHPSPQPAGYRARVAVRPDQNGVLGQSMPGTHDHVPLTSVHLARPELNHVLGTLPALPGLGQVELRSDGQTVVMSAWSPRKGRGARARRNRGATAGVKNRLRDLDLGELGVAGVALDGRALSGDCTTRLTVQGIEHRLSPATFYQVNLGINAVLVEAVQRLADEVQPTTVLDLYAGAGNLSLPMAARGVPTVLIDQEGSSTADARRTIKRLGLPASVRTADAAAFEAGDVFFDLAIVDPPRAGAPGLLPRLLVTRPAALLYVSCNPRALARDLRPALAAGYTVDRLEIFDMFPQTLHVEALVRLRRPA